MKNNLMENNKKLASIKKIDELKVEYCMIFCKRKMSPDDVNEIINRDMWRHKDLPPDFFEMNTVFEYSEFLKMLEARYVLQQLIEEDYGYVAVHRKKLEGWRNVDYYIFSEKSVAGLVWCLKVGDYNIPCCFELCMVDEIKELPKQEEMPIYDLAYEIGVYWREK